MLGAAEGIADKILDRDQHRRDELRILAHRILGRHMGDQQPGMTVDQEHVFDLVDQRMLEHDLGEGPSSAPGFPAPLEPSPGEAVFQGLIEPLERLVNGLADRFADRRHDRRIKDVDQRCGIAPDRALRRLLHDGRQHMPHPLVARRLGDRGRQDAPDHRSQALGIVHDAGEPRQRLDLAADQQGPQLLELQIARAAHRFAPRAARASGSPRFRRADSPALSDRWRHRPRASEAAPQGYRGRCSPHVASWPPGHAMVRSRPCRCSPRPGSGTWRPRRTARPAGCDRS